MKRTRIVYDAPESSLGSPHVIGRLNAPAALAEEAVAVAAPPPVEAAEPARHPTPTPTPART
ncbi:hypothetical protein, partial [Streptomyces europaeiscabiei]|uniref:hypothetical protein n=1 Tax=Streptomyces europaeiscabiei TaxID=146819 RepID=UPI0006283B95